MTKASTPKSTEKLSEAFQIFLGTPKAARFRQSDVAEALYPLTRPRDRKVASEKASKFIKDAHKAGRLDRTGHLHWMIRSVDVCRTLLNGQKVPEVVGLVQLPINTHCPGKWVSVDLESGEVWQGTMNGWTRAPDEGISGLLMVTDQSDRPLYYHPQASHVAPDRRDGWNAALKAAGVPPSTQWK